MSGNPPVQTLLSQARFAPIHRDWLAPRDQDLARRLESVAVRAGASILLLNATLGLQLYPSIVDFFVILRRVLPGVQVTSASYAAEIHELGAEVARKGLEVRSIAEVEAWGRAELDRFDAVIAIGPSDALFRLMATPGLRPRLVLLDLAFYHQLIESTKGAFLDREHVSPQRASQENRVVCYSCQPARKVQAELHRFIQAGLIEWRWFNYIPIGFRYCDYHRSDEAIFDVALLGSGGRDYAQIDARAFRGRRFLFLGAAERAPAVARLASEVDVTFVSRVDEVTYARLLALCRCVIVPLTPQTDNVLLSTVDTLASGLPLLASRVAGFARLVEEEAPMVLFDGARDLAEQAAALLDAEARRREMGERALAFARRRLDIYRILETILREEIA